MFKKVLQKIGQYTKAVLKTTLQGSGTAALYLGASAFLAAVLTGIVLKYAWDVDNTKWNRALAILQGLEIVEIQKAEQDKAAEITYETVLEARAKRLRENEYNREVTQQVAALPPPPEPPKPVPPPAELSAAEQISAYEKRVQDDLATSRSNGLAEETRLLANMDAEQAKEVIRKLWKDGANQRVLQMLMDMEEKPRGDILYAMQQENDEELKDLCEILQRIGDGDPMTPIINSAANPP